MHNADIERIYTYNVHMNNASSDYSITDYSITDYSITDHSMTDHSMRDYIDWRSEGRHAAAYCMRLWVGVAWKWMGDWAMGSR